MMRKKLPLFLLILVLASPVAAQGPPDPTKLVEAQKEAMDSLSFLDGVWKGTAWTLLPSGEKETLLQTERIGPFLDGAVKVIEGRGYDADGKVAFNAFATLSFDPQSESYSMRSYAMGRSGDFEWQPTEDGFTWEIPAGPATIRYRAVVREDTWHQVGDRLVPGREPVRFFEMTLKRVGDTDWPRGGAVEP